MQRASARLVDRFLRCRHGNLTGEQWSSVRQEAGISGVSAPSPSQLGQVVHLEEFLKKSREEVEEIWLGYHADVKSGRVGSVLKADAYSKFVRNAKESPMFVLPLAKPSGFETLLIQCQLPYVLITGLEEYRRRGEGAPPYLTVTHYPELLDSHGLALVRGDIIHDKGMSREEARTAMELTRAFYTSDDDYPLVHTFNHKPAAFDYAALLRKLSLAA